MPDIRVEGTPEEIAAVVAILTEKFDVRSGPCRFYPNRDSVKIGRVFLSVETPEVSP